MAIFSKETLETLRQRLDLKEVVEPYVQLKRAGGAYKALCPFHNEKSPSFVIQSGDTHYHCFGCGAHGDAISFLVQHLKVTFVEAVEILAERFAVPISYEEGKGETTIDLSPLKMALSLASEFYHFHLLHSEEGRFALKYLYQRGIDLEFIEMFQIGFAPKEEALQMAFYREKRVKEEVLIEAGLAKRNAQGRLWPFFSNRITFPIMDISSNVIGFSARKIHEETFGGKYINTQETPLFKKSKVLFGFNFSRRRIAKEKKVIVVEGQIDALRLIQEKIDYTVAGQGTAFGKTHVQLLTRLGIAKAYLAFDGDQAGREAREKVGQLFQKEGIEVLHLLFPEGFDPDLILQKEGAEGFLSYLGRAKDHISFLVSHYGKELDVKTPAGKNQLAQRILAQIRDWDHPLMIHEGTKRLAEVLQVPERMLEVEDKKGFEKIPEDEKKIDPIQIIETDLLRWLVISSHLQKNIVTIAEKNLFVDNLLNQACKSLYQKALSAFKERGKVDLLDLAENARKDEQLILNQIFEKRVNIERAEEGIVQTITKILERNWMMEREKIKLQIQNGNHSEEKLLQLAREFDEIKKQQPKVVRPKEEREL